jgi:hypothetical protein
MKELSGCWDEAKERPMGRWHLAPTSKRMEAGEGGGSWQKMRNLLWDCFFMREDLSM